jgi:NDP-sugar pyrophosphorylase family protein
MPLQSSHHVVDIGDDGLITQVTPMQDLKQWENGGYFTLRPEIFDHLNPGEDLVEDAIPRLIPQRKVLAYPYKGYFSPADTVKERVRLEEMYHQGHCPWMVGPGAVRAPPGRRGPAVTWRASPAVRSPAGPAAPFAGHRRAPGRH